MQVLLGVTTIGLFLNSFSHQLSEKKDELKQKEDKKISADNLAKLLTILRPAVVSYLEIIAETYKVTANEEKGSFKVKPSELFDQAYYDQISLQNFLSMETRYGKGTMTWGKFIVTENKKFTQDIDGFLTKFATILPIDIVDLLVKLQNHIFLGHAQTALLFNDISTQLHVNHPIPQIHLLTQEHSSIDLPNKQETIKDFHQTLLKLISIIDNSLSNNPMEITIYLINGTAPPVGSAIGDIIKFGPF